MNTSVTMSIREFKEDTLNALLAINKEFARHRNYEPLDEGVQLPKKIEKAKHREDDAVLYFSRGQGEALQTLHFVLAASIRTLSLRIGNGEIVKELYIPTASQEELHNFVRNALTDYYNR